MAEISLGGLVGIVGLVATVCSIASFILGQKKAVTADATSAGKDKGLIESDMNNIKEAIKSLTTSINTLTIKLEAQDEKREKDYREMLVSLTEVKSSYKSLHLRLDTLEKRLEGVSK